MSYIGNTPAENYASFLTQTFSVTATASYTLDHAVSNENDIRLVINNVVQQPGSGKAYTASGTTLTLSEATASTDVMYCVYLGRALQTVNPPNASVGTSQLADGAVTSNKLSGVTQGITMADQFRLTADLANPGAADITANLERVDTNGFAKIGTGMTESSGIFTFPSTGLFLVRFMATVFYDNDYMGIEIFVSTDGSNFVSADMSNGGTTTVNGFFTLSGECFINVTNTSNFKVKFKTNSMTASTIEGDTNQTRTGFTFIRLGDSQ